MSFVLCKNGACTGEMYSSISAYKQHLSIAHSRQRETMCFNCPTVRSFSNWGSLREHLSGVHGIPNNEIIAPRIESQAEANGCTADSVADADGTRSDSKDEDDGAAIGSSCGSPDASRPVSPDDDSAETLDLPNIAEKFSLVLREKADCLVAKLYSKPGIPRNMIDVMITDIRAFVDSGFMTLLQDYVSYLLTLGEVDAAQRAVLTNMFQELRNPFQHLSTEHLRTKYFELLGDYIAPCEYTIFSRRERINTPDGPKLRNYDVTGQYIPLSQVFKRFLEIPNALEDILSYMEKVYNDDNLLSNFIQGSVWQRKLAQFKPGDIVLPLMVSYDDFEPNAALGNHSEKLGAIYVFFACLPPEIRSRLENIFLAVLFNADDRSSYGNKKVCEPLLRELKELETDGLIIDLPGKSVKVYIVLGLILGDNLGLNSLNGFPESFLAMFFCRMCKAPRLRTLRMLKEDPEVVRSPENYLADVATADPAATGVKEACVFSALESFVAPDDIGIDCFHDVAEGVCHYTMIPVINHLRQVNNVFLDVLNQRLYLFNYGPDSDNIPPTISEDSLKKTKLKMTGAEMITFVRFFGILVGDLVDAEDEFWSLYLLLFDIVSIVEAKSLPKDVSELFPVIVKEHHQLYL